MNCWAQGHTAGSMSPGDPGAASWGSGGARLPLAHSDA